MVHPTPTLHLALVTPLLLGLVSGAPQLGIIEDALNRIKDRLQLMGWPIKQDTQYVAFGDSYAAGMGSGTTTGSWWPGEKTCRVGSLNYAKQLHQEAWEISGIKHRFNEKYCSGDTTIGLNRQIDEWQEPQEATMATVSVGGNDLGFADIVKNCLVKAPYHQGNMDEECKKAKDKANSMLEATGPDSFRENIKGVYTRILDKSGNKELQLFVTGYPQFFNQDTDRCDKVTFDFWKIGFYDNPADCADCIFLTKDVRRYFNDMNKRLNAFIKGIVEETAAQRSAAENNAAKRVHFVDNDSVFSNHRWCEPGVNEPDANNPNQWFFLAAWPDVVAENGSPEMFKEAGVYSQNAKVVAENNYPRGLNAGPFPPKEKCQEAAKADPEVGYLYCALAERLGKEVKVEHVNSGPTRYTKMFHPRSVAYTATKYAVMGKFAEILASKGGSAPPPPPPPPPPPEIVIDCGVKIEQWGRCSPKTWIGKASVINPDGTPNTFIREQAGTLTPQNGLDGWTMLIPHNLNQQEGMSGDRLLKMKAADNGDLTLNWEGKQGSEKDYQCKTLEDWSGDRNKGCDGVPNGKTDVRRVIQCSVACFKAIS